MEAKYYLELTEEEYNLLKSELLKRYLTPEVFQLWEKINKLEPRKLGNFDQEEQTFREYILAYMTDEDLELHGLSPSQISDETFIKLAVSLQWNLEEGPNSGEGYGAAFREALEEVFPKKYHL